MRTLPPLDDSCKLEHQVAQILTEQEIHGWTFDERKALELESHLRRDGRNSSNTSRTIPFRCRTVVHSLNEITQHKDTSKDVKYNE